MNENNALHSDLQTFKAAVKRRALKLCVLAFLVAAAINSKTVLYGIIFGACIGFVNLNMMFHHAKNVKSSPVKARNRAFGNTIIRFGLFIAAGIAGMYRNFNPWAMIAGFLLTYVSLISIPITERLKLKFLTPKQQNDINL